MVLALPQPRLIRRRRIAAFSMAVLINILCLWLLQYGMRVPARLRLPNRETLVELLPLPMLATPTKAPAPPAPSTVLPQHSAKVQPRQAPPSPQAITLDQPVTRPELPRPIASAPVPKLDMEALRNGARRLGDQDKADPDAGIKLNLKPAQEAAPSALSQEMAKAQRGSCKTAHEGLGLLAPLALLNDAVSGSGCSWQ